MEILYSGNNWRGKRNNGKDSEAMQNRIIGKLWSTLAPGLARKEHKRQASFGVCTLEEY